MREFDWGRQAGRRIVEHERVLTVPNLVSALRLGSLPVFAWLVLGLESFAAALVVLVVAGATDWVDGYLARRLDQVTKLGRMLDPLVDRAMVVTVGVTLLAAGLVPAWVVALVVVRDVAVLGGAFLLFGRLPPIAVTRVGKTATASLLVALPLFLLVGLQWPGMRAAEVAAWVFVGIGLVAYYVAGVQYARQALALRRSRH